jgi:hypothetical protein
MKDTDISDVSSEIFAVGSQFTESIGRSMIKGIIQKLLITVDDRVQFLRNSEHHMKIWCFEHILPACVHPLFFWEFLAHGTAPVTTGIIVERNTAAVLAHADIDTKSTCLAVHDVISCFSLNRREFMSFLILRIKSIEHILDCTKIPHDSPPFGSS